MWTRFPATETGRFSLRATFLLSSRTSRWQRQDPWIALVAQGIERLPPEQKVVGSNPIEGTEETPAAWKSGGGFCVRPVSAQTGKLSARSRTVHLRADSGPSTWSSGS